MIKTFGIALIAISGVAAMADVSAIAPGTKEEGVANVASQIFSVTNLKIGKYAYQIVAMDSELNGDINTTTVVLVGEGGVGGAAGYEAAFQLSPTADLQNMKSARVENGKIALTFYNLDGKLVKKTYQYDPKTKTLKE